MSSILSPMGVLVRRHDPDRFYCALFAPAAQREALFTLYAFNHELARAREVTSEPTLALIRLEWWREVVEGASKRHEVATPLSATIAQGSLLPGDLLAMIDGREQEADGLFATNADWLAYLDAIAGRLMLAAGRLLGAQDLDRLRALGTACGIAGQLRSIGVLAHAGRCQLPQDALAAAGMTAHDVIAHRHPDRLLAVVRGLAEQGNAMLGDAGGRLPSAAALPAVLARRDLRRIGAKLRPRGLGDRLAVLAAAMLGRI
jgi:phytoene synthase